MLTAAVLLLHMLLVAHGKMLATLSPGMQASSSRRCRLLRSLLEIFKGAWPCSLA